MTSEHDLGVFQLAFGYEPGGLDDVICSPSEWIRFRRRRWRKLPYHFAKFNGCAFVVRVRGDPTARLVMSANGVLPGKHFQILLDDGLFGHDQALRSGLEPASTTIGRS